jgi:hypothetical protein
MSLFSVFSSLSAWLAALVGVSAGQQSQTVSRIVVQDTIIVRVPVRPMRKLPELEWVEKKGPKCLPIQSIAMTGLSGPSSIDFLLRDRRRIRAELDSDCPALDFYGGFYLQVDDDDQICAKRDEIRSRVGGSCRIEKFRTMVPQVKH